MDEQENMMSQNARPEPTWFFERTGDGKVFACGEDEAWSLLHNRNNWMRRDFKMLGHSDGTTYFDMIKNAKGETARLQSEKAELEQNLVKYSQTEDDLRFKQLKDDDDEMVIRVVAKRKETQAKIDEINSQLKDINKTIIDRAFNAELEKARGNLVQPSNRDIITPNTSDRNRILNQIRG